MKERCGHKNWRAFYVAFFCKPNTLAICSNEYQGFQYQLSSMPAMSNCKKVRYTKSKKLPDHNAWRSRNTGLSNRELARVSQRERLAILKCERILGTIDQFARWIDSKIKRSCSARARSV